MLIHEDDAGVETIRVEAESDDHLVLHITGEDRRPDLSQISAVGTTIKFLAPTTEIESWVYLPEDAVKRLRDACDAWLALDAS